MSDETINCPACGEQLTITAKRTGKDGPTADQRKDIDCVTCWRSIVVEDSGPIRCSGCHKSERGCSCVRLKVPA